jgi:hypothetical protein
MALKKAPPTSKNSKAQRIGTFFLPIELDFDLKPGLTDLSPVAGDRSISGFLSVLTGFCHCGQALPALAQNQAGGEKTKPGQRNSIHWTHKAFLWRQPV